MRDNFPTTPIFLHFSSRARSRKSPSLRPLSIRSAESSKLDAQLKFLYFCRLQLFVYLLNGIHFLDSQLLAFTGIRSQRHKPGGALLAWPLKQYLLHFGCRHACAQSAINQRNKKGKKVYWLTADCTPDSNNAKTRSI